MITSSRPTPGCAASIACTTPSYARPTAIVLVRTIGVSIRPHSAIVIEFVSSPAPLSTAVPAAIGESNSVSSASGTITVTPVRATAGSSCHTVTCPTRTPGTSTMPLVGPGVMVPITTPRSRARARGAGGDVLGIRPSVRATGR